MRSHYHIRNANFCRENKEDLCKIKRFELPGVAWKASRTKKTRFLLAPKDANVKTASRRKSHVQNFFSCSQSFLKGDAFNKLASVMHCSTEWWLTLSAALTHSRIFWAEQRWHFASKRCWSIFHSPDLPVKTTSLQGSLQTSWDHTPARLFGPSTKANDFADTRVSLPEACPAILRKAFRLDSRISTWH